MLTPIADQLSTDYLVLTVMWADLFYDIEQSTLKAGEPLAAHGNRIEVILRKSLIQTTKDVNPRL